MTKSDWEERFDEFIGTHEAEKRYERFELGKLMLEGLREYNKSVKEFFAEAWDDTQTRHDKIMQKAWAEENKEQIEQEEKKILEELKKKYESY